MYPRYGYSQPKATPARVVPQESLSNRPKDAGGTPSAKLTEPFPIGSRGHETVPVTWVQSTESFSGKNSATRKPAESAKGRRRNAISQAGRTVSNRKSRSRSSMRSETATSQTCCPGFRTSEPPSVLENQAIAPTRHEVLSAERLAVHLPGRSVSGGLVKCNSDMGGQSSSTVPCKIGLLVEDMHSLATNMQTGARDAHQLTFVPKGVP
jgi:hypothetical protein